MKKTLIILCIICPVIFIYNIHIRDFWAPDEGDFAEIVTELSGNFVVPHLNGKPYGEKPPLFYYITYATQRMFYMIKDEGSMRLPTALFACFCALFLFLTINRIFDKERAVFTVYILITAPLYYWQARYMQMDMIFSFFVTCGLLLFYWYYNKKKPYFLYICFLFMGLAFLTKGPLSIVLMLPVVIFFLAFEKNFNIIKPKEIFIGSIIFLSVVLPWYAAIYLKEGMPYLYENIIRQNINRFLDAWSHKRPIYYYFTTLPLDFFPWSLFLPAGIYTILTKFRRDSKVKFFILWFLWMLVFFSLSSGKISKYMLPVLPSISLITSYAFIKKDSKYNSLIYLICSIIFFILGSGLLFYHYDIYKEFMIERILIGSLCLIFTATNVFLLSRKKQGNLFIIICLFMLCCYVIANSSVYEKLNAYKSPKSMCEKIKTHIGDTKPWVYYGSIRGVYVYYVGKQAIHVDEHKVDELHKLKTNLEQFYILTRKRDMDEISNTLTSVKIIFEEKIGGTVMVFAYFKREK